MALLVAPFLPDTAPVLLARLGLPGGLAGAKLPDDAVRFGALAPGTAVTKGAALFPRVETGGAA
jgi:methionyl-tRNA synthetase